MTNYLDMSGGMIHRAAAEERLFNKLKTKLMPDDMRAWGACLGAQPHHRRFCEEGHRQHPLLPCRASPKKTMGEVERDGQ
jgi:hypothetical protein